MNMRLISAEILKLRKRRGLMIACVLMTIGVIVVGNIVAIVLHAANPDKHGPAGGIDNLSGFTAALFLLGSIAAVLLGATAGAGDLNAGVFRELVVTGRSRIALFLARVPGGLVVLWALVLISYVITAVLAIAFAGDLTAPSAALIIKGGAWVLLATGFYFVVSLGLASVVGSRSTSIAVLLAFRLAVGPILTHVSYLGSAREAIPDPALERLTPAAFNAEPELHEALATAVALVLLWIVVSLAVGAWRTQTRDA
jgi:ABC-2 family transporter